ncbi:hypothetical protein EHEL_091180 [Encephalitozoon hellem ATCC 50504]|uniref:WD40 domain-containing protein n=1 Tax=Encephalitozoon hellem TaxID=27973 RepID=A0A9Q9FA67_ENCHE|nr:uncharacterized protein EHEL_091180 [Encephalitozoon hellem ATCC 50504]AFM99013.1 hypothetical protein EHEL_091180 [Encephalitozoon hellem ATCC 50504]UTX44031.1 hypothetical protein GPU96_09g18110 [Encephalitozoon hellem]WEL39514.1 hypothetical protein PFJ87_09g01420 [Encephalitozoon hellem]|eukprot:XP_003887994.1 hypothetical protein EHEL_091180 [Encephalitozoon hellem ATCC 50504]
MRYKITSKRLNEKILAVHVNGEVYTGGTSKTLINQGTGEVMCRTQKSIRSIASHGKYVCCGSYDCTAVLFCDGNVVDVIEGPDTEIKCVAFSEDGKYLAMATRGKAVWVVRIGEEIEIEEIIEDHLHDVKGCIFHGGFLFTYGYDNTVKVYDRFDYDGTWELVQSIDERSTVWCVIFHEGKMICTTEEGMVSSYILRNGWECEVSRKLSMLPIYTICSVGGNMAYALNRGSIGIIDGGLNVVETIENVHEDFINGIAYDERTGRIVSGGDDGILNVIELL